MRRVPFISIAPADFLPPLVLPHLTYFVFFAPPPLPFLKQVFYCPCPLAPILRIFFADLLLPTPFPFKLSSPKQISHDAGVEYQTEIPIILSFLKARFFIWRKEPFVRFPISTYKYAPSQFPDLEETERTLFSPRKTRDYFLIYGKR